MKSMVDFVRAIARHVTRMERSLHRMVRPSGELGEGSMTMLSAMKWVEHEWGASVVLLKIEKSERCQRNNRKWEAGKHSKTGKWIPKTWVGYHKPLSFTRANSSSKPAVKGNLTEMNQKSRDDRDGKCNPRELEKPYMNRIDLRKIMPECDGEHQGTSRESDNLFSEGIKRCISQFNLLSVLLLPTHWRKNVAGPNDLKISDDSCVAQLLPKQEM